MVSNEVLAAKHGCGKSTVTEILGKQRAKIVESFEQGQSDTKIRKMRIQKFEDMTSNLLSWCQAAFAANLEGLSDALLLEKSRSLAVEMGFENLDGLNLDWIQRFKKRHNIKTRKQVGEAGNVDQQSVEDWKASALPEIKAQYGDNDIFNLDETGLFWEVLPDRTMSFKGDRCVGGKKSKNRITILLGANMTGTQKLPVFAIGKSQKPRCFRGVNVIPVTYYANKKAWMTSELFLKIIKQLDRTFCRDVAFILDNCPAHPKIISDLIHIKLFYLPPNTTSVMQPMDAGVIHNFKSHYRRRLAQRRLFAYDSNCEFNFNLLDSLYFVRDSWRAVTQSTIANCFNHCGFNNANIEVEETVNEADVEI